MVVNDFDSIRARRAVQVKQRRNWSLMRMLCWPVSGGGGVGAGYPSPGHAGSGGSGLVLVRYRLEPAA